MKPSRQSKCKVCRALFTKRSITHKACSLECALELAKQEREKKERKSDRQRKVKLRTRSDWIKLAQIAFNGYIRARDKGKPCICCGQPLGEQMNGGGYDCGHYRSVGSAPHLRFDPRNAHGQTKKCNRWGSGRAVDYRLGLIQRIGLAEVEALEADQTPRKYTIEELQEITIRFKRMTKELMQ